MDNLFFWKYFFGGGLLVANLVFTIVLLALNLWLLYVVYFCFFFGHYLFIGKPWRYLFIKDAYLSKDLNKIEFLGSTNVSQQFDCNQIVKCKTAYGITDIVIDDNGNNVKFYFMINSKENLKYLRPSIAK